MKSKSYPVVRDTSLDFLGEAYATAYPNLHRYPATMIPQLGISLLDRFGITSGKLLDPYCGSGSSFASAIHVGLKSLYGFDLNPLAVLISKAKFTAISAGEVEACRSGLIESVRRLRPASAGARDIPRITNIDYWFSESSILELTALKRVVDALPNRDLRDLVLLALSETIRDVSYTRKNEFKLYRIPPEKLASHAPDVRATFLAYVEKILDVYLAKYLPRLKGVKIAVTNDPFKSSRSQVDVVLTSPPYGDSRTTVAYGQFSTLTNEWLGIEDARGVDSRLMGGRRVKQLLEGSIISSELIAISEVDKKRALEVSSFYEDLGSSIRNVSCSIKHGGYSIYIVGNRRVKDVQLSTDQFIAEEFERSGLEHVATFERLISSKSMPAVNSPSNKAGVTRGTMTQEFVVVCRKNS